ncbi:hypothetical protein KN200_00785 [Clavibacter michiganensis subsp. michiganensis]|uniref:phage infection protein n=1 Tax=Clavibacter michiganensis TaxID=28447 RepID=UPI000A39B176|nr:phage infection protein [Clavibacter michiganensis]MDO4100090.1 hypothetical protein [Clavibacter michiganensis]MDO4128532.1 hypothetical protein [Clavibacter michiganensis]NIY59086.1 phage infection protein [Clavibacter michiganensis subsp. michiganensis]OUE29139.1 hypothetical protein CMMCA001_00205 [Clavibacter michiganensis subsp. michiganensis]QXP06023.1 hypothetical protein KN200_00785 [Clavibacter michiganensis subsp. michiganensis]
MKSLQLELRNCHGIRELDAILPFDGKRAVAIYAPNGTMKSSLARTFNDFSHGTESTDHVFPDRVSDRKIVDEDGTEPDASAVAVFLSYDEHYAPDDFASTLLVNAPLRIEFETINKDLLELEVELAKALKKTARTKQDVTSVVSQIFSKQDDNFFGALARVSYDVEQLADPPFADLPYDVLFNPSVEKVLSDAGMRDLLTEYVKRLNELLDGSSFFSRSSFNYYNAETVSKSLVSQGFFKANHSLLLSGEDESHEVSTEADLITLIADEKQRITDDEELMKRLSALEKALNANQATRDFFRFVSDRPELLVNFVNIELFKEEIWISYLKANEDIFIRAVSYHKASEERRKKILSQAAKERTRWEEVIDLFNARFAVPFTLVPRNREKVMLAQETVLTLDFEFKDGGGSSRVDREHLLQVLSTGEKKAFYILNILFEVEARKNSGGLSIFVIDDIADSFDYKNKYAIIYYLKEMEENANFRLIILTHNFDFLRTIFGRGIVGRGHCFMAEKSLSRVKFNEMSGSTITNPFTKDFKRELFTDGMKRIACIPFVRNLLEYSRGTDDGDYLRLTSLLHQKTDTLSIKQSELDRIFSDNLAGLPTNSWPVGDEPVLDMIYIEADKALEADEGVNFANKIVLSMAIRLRAESYMLSLIDEARTTNAITRNQTWALYKLFKDRSLSGEEELAVLRSVLLMTPENLHINSFMYEPIIDMSDGSLRELYRRVAELDRSTL